MGELKKYIEDMWGIQLMKEPRWLGKSGVGLQPIVVHMARCEERKAFLGEKEVLQIDNEGYAKKHAVEGNVANANIRAEMQERSRKEANGLYKCRIYTPAIGSYRCSTCTKMGHTWWKCPERGNKAKHRWGVCAAFGHTTWEHVCGIEGCRMRGRACYRHAMAQRQRNKCAECSGNHLVKECGREAK